MKISSFTAESASASGGLRPPDPLPGALPLDPIGGLRPPNPPTASAPIGASA